MGAFSSRMRQNAAVDEAEQNSNHALYKYPPRSGNFFGSHFIMGGERFDTPQPESYLFGENADLNFLGNRPTAFPYPPPQTNEPTKTLKCLINIRKESVRFVRIPLDKKRDSVISMPVPPTMMALKHNSQEQIDGNICSIPTLGSAGGSGGGGAETQPPYSYNIEFTFDSDARCAITIYYFCAEEVSPSGVTLVPRDGFISETYHYEKGINQLFSQPGHVFNPQLIPEDDLIYNPSKEQYPVAIHCVVEEGSEECRQSHTTICVIDHHPESNSYVLRALKQKIFVDGLCYLLQEIYGIENKAVNKSSIDEDLDDHGSECVICMSDTRDTLILPCRHLCLCNSCADSLRYQANNCPICRAPFRALLQIRAVQKGVSLHMLHQNTPTSGAGEQAPCDQHIPQGYIPVSLIEALNGPPQYVARPRHSESDAIDGVILSGGTPLSIENHKTTSSPHKPNSQRRQKVKKNVSTSTNHEIGTNTTIGSSNDQPPLSVIDLTELDNETQKLSNSESGEKLGSRTSQDKLQIVNERHSLKLPKHKRNSVISTNQSSGGSVGAGAISSHTEGEDDDSENEKLSPLLSPGSKCIPLSQQLVKALTIDGMNTVAMSNDDMNYDDNCIDCQRQQQQAEDEVEMKSISSLKKHKRPDLVAGQTVSGNTSKGEPVTMNPEDSDYYTPEDPQNSILSPLCPDRAKSSDKLKSNMGSFKGTNSNMVKKNLQKKSTSVGNIVGSTTAGASAETAVAVATDIKANVSSLPDMLDSPISGNSASTRSSSDSYSSSSSTKQLLNNPNSTAANIIVDDKTSLQNAVNV